MDCDEIITKTKVSGGQMTTASHGNRSHDFHMTHHHGWSQGEPNEYVCGAIASLFNVIVTFPINKVMFRQQVHGIRFFKACRQLQKEGAMYIYRGLLPPLLQRTATVSLMFGTYTNYRHFLQDKLPHNLPHNHTIVHILAAAGAGSTEALLVPFERIQVILQVRDYHHRFQNTYHAYRVVSGYGIRELYRGCSAILLRNATSNVLFLGLRDPIKGMLPQPQTNLGETLNAFISGAGLGAMLSTMFFPLNVIKSRMQSRLGGHFPGIIETFYLIYAERQGKWRKMFRGVHINYTRSFISWGIINATYDFLTKHLVW